MSKSLTLSVQNLGKQFNGKIIFRNLKFEWKEGILGIAGPNGSGKSTLLRCLSYLMTPSAGRITWYIGGSEIEKAKLRNYIGFVAPYINLYPELTPIENLRLLSDLRGLKKTDSDFGEFLAQFEADHLGDQHFGSLSTGQQQRIKMASALLHQPQVLFLDEPGANLDGAGKHLVQNLFNEYRNEKGKILILASNRPDEISASDRRLNLVPGGKAVWNSQKSTSV